MPTPRSTTGWHRVVAIDHRGRCRGMRVASRSARRVESLRAGAFMLSLLEPVCSRCQRDVGAEDDSEPVVLKMPGTAVSGP